MVRYFLPFVFSILGVLSSSASIKPDFDAMPDSLLPNKSRAVIVKDTVNYLSANLSSTLSIEMKKLQIENGDSCICFIKTYKAPEEHSLIEYYDKKWNWLATQYFSLSDFVDCVKNPIVKTLIDPVLISAHLSPSSDTMILNVSTFMLSEDEKKEIKDYPLTKYVKWNGKIR